MGLTRRVFLGISATAAIAALTGCSSLTEIEEEPVTDGTEEPVTTPEGTLALDSAAWNYDSDNDVYWQLGLQYCETPAAEDYETLGIFVPGSYFTAEDNGDGTFTCTIGEGSVSGFTAQTAPIVMPVNTAGYSAQEPPSQYDYQSISEFIGAGFVYVYAGCRGRDNGYDDEGNLIFSGGAPWGVTDLKAAVRYVRYNSALIPGNVDSVFAFGHSGGGAQSAILGASGNSDLYEPYLESIGAAMDDGNGSSLGDDIAGAICWCPITCLDQADAAYEWMMGQYASSGTREDGTWTKAFSDGLAQRFADYVNDTAFTDSEGNVLELESSSGSVFAKGSYYDYLLNLVNDSLNNFLSDTQFPYTPSDATMADGGFGAGMAGGPGNGGTPPDGAPSGSLPSGDAPAEESTESPDESSGDSDGTDNPDVSGDEDSSESTEENGDSGDSQNAKGAGKSDGSGESTDDEVTYETVSDYIDALNEDEEWVAYDSKTKTATISSLEAFVKHCKQPTKDVGAFDMLDRSAAENSLFGNDENNELHFDSWMAELLQANSGEYSGLDNWDDAYVDDYASDIEQVDSLGTTMADRMAMYNPLYYVSDAYEGAGTSTVAPHWRIHSGIEQGDTSLTTETNLALALQASSKVQDVEFITVWGQGHTMAERTGDATENAVAWIKNLLIGG